MSLVIKYIKLLKILIGNIILERHVNIYTSVLKGELQSDIYFREIGYNNIVVEIIDNANDSETLAKKEIEWIRKHIGDEKNVKCSIQ